MPRKVSGGIGVVALGAALIAGACGPRASAESERTAAERVASEEAAASLRFEGLVVLVVIDQLPQYLVERYDTLFSGGLRRLLDEGRVYSRAVHDHARTTTGPGHASIATGVHPWRHGVVDNSWHEPDGDGWASVDNYFDSTEDVVGAGDGRGFSPRVLQASGLADWLKRADPGARVFAVSGKVRGAVPLAGRGAGHVYVIDDDFGPAFVTSTYYRDREPDWVRRFNTERLAELLADSVWESTVPPSAAGASRPDSADYERRGRHATFPHTFSEEEADWRDAAHGFMGWYWHTPMLDEASIALGMEAVRAMDLGRRDGVDLLALALSATDPIGHRYGPFSREQLDNLLRLDRALGELFRFLDDVVGRDRVLVAFSADHGVLAAPEHRRERGEVGVRVPIAEVNEALRAAARLQAASEVELHEARAAFLEELDFVADAMTREELLDLDPSTPLDSSEDSLVALYRRSFQADRVMSPGRLGVLVRLREGHMAGDVTATHGSPYLYDRHVPLILMGPGVEPGQLDERVSTVDIAPTLAALVGLGTPQDLDGRDLMQP